MLSGKRILLGVSGSIAAYKIAVLTRLLVKAGAEVKVVMTPSAKDFVSKLTLSTLSKNPVLVDLFDEQSWANHVMLGRWADVMLIAPLSCNTMAKMAHGLCDNLLLAIYLSATCPVVVAPAMDEDMWLHPSTRANLERIQAYGNRIIPVEKGELASGLYGPGRMAEPAAAAAPAAAPAVSMPSKISALASAMASTVPKYSRCAGATVVIRATWGRAIFTKARISPA